MSRLNRLDHRKVAICILEIYLYKYAFIYTLTESGTSHQRHPLRAGTRQASSGPSRQTSSSLCIQGWSVKHGGLRVFPSPIFVGNYRANSVAMKLQALQRHK